MPINAVAQKPELRLSYFRVNQQGLLGINKG
jgi:hypothetical protein